MFPKRSKQWTISVLVTSTSQDRFAGRLCSWRSKTSQSHPSLNHVLRKITCSSFEHFIERRGSTLTREVVEESVLVLFDRRVVGDNFLILMFQESLNLICRKDKDSFCFHARKFAEQFHQSLVPVFDLVFVLCQSSRDNCAWACCLWIAVRLSTVVHSDAFAIRMHNGRQDSFKILKI